MYDSRCVQVTSYISVFFHYTGFLCHLRVSQYYHVSQSWSLQKTPLSLYIVFLSYIMSESLVITVYIGYVYFIRPCQPYLLYLQSLDKSLFIFLREYPVTMGTN